LNINPEIIPAAIVVGIMLLVGLPVHEFSHAFAAFRLGDGTAKLFGRLTLNPVAHFDPIGGTLLALTFIGSAAAGGAIIGFGWAKPTPVNPLNLDGGRRGEAIVAAAGPISNLVLAAAGAIPLRYLYANPQLIIDVPMLEQILVLFVQINLLLMIFNLIPIPPLDGSKVMFAFLDRRTEYQIRPFLEQWGFFILIALLFIPPGNSIGGRIILPILDTLYGVLVGS
jgi:Zn-dependent protease